MWFFDKKKKQKRSEISLDLNDVRSEEGHCFISGNISVHGEVQFAGTLRVDGRVEGKVSNYPGKQGTLVVSRGAYINGPVETSNVICDGTIHGNVRVDGRLEVRTHGLIKGDMFYDKLSTAEGAELIGKCHQRQQGGGVRLESVGSPRFSHSLATRNVAPLSTTAKKKFR